MRSLFQVCELISKVTGLQEEQSVVTLTGTLRLTNLQEKLFSEAKVVESDESAIGGLFNMLTTKKDDKPPIDLNITSVDIYKKVGKERLVFARGSGNYARYLQIGGEVYYQHSKIDYPGWIFEEPAEWTLPSSSVLRKELALIREHRYDEANKFAKKST